MQSKNKVLFWFLGFVLLVFLTALSIYVYSQNKNLKNKNNGITLPEIQNQEETSTEITATNCTGDSCLSINDLEYPVGRLPVEVSNSVKIALDDEYKAFSTYDSVISKIGTVRPFSMIIRAEESHIASLKSILDKYGENIPVNSYSGKIAPKTTLKENCQIGADAEIANVALYENQLIPKVSAYPDIISVFTSLMNASRDKHLPAFEKCN